MKQGTGHSSASARKVEPTSKAVCVEAAAQFGASTAFKKEDVYEGRGLEAPKVGVTIHHGGSQGRHT